MVSRSSPKSYKTAPREQIVEAALQLYLKQGVAGTRMLDIAKEAGVSHPLLRYHFPDVTTLTQAVIEKILKSLADLSVEFISKGTTAEDKLTRYVSAPFEWSKRNPGHFSIWMYFYYQASLENDFRSRNSEIRLGGRSRIEALLNEGIVAGQFRKMDSATVREMSVLIQGLITGNVILAFTESGLNGKQLAELTQRAVLEWLRPIKD